MKKMIIASAIVLVSSGALAEWEDAWQNPDLNTGAAFSVGTPTEIGRHLGSTSLDDLSKLNPDLYHGGSSDGVVRAASFIGPTSLDVFLVGNADNYSGGMDLGIVVDDRGEMVGQSR